MEMAGNNPEGYHKYHNNPSFDIEKREGAVFLPLSGYPLGMLKEQTAKDEIEKQEEHDYSLTDLKQPVVCVIYPGNNPYPQDIRPGYYPHTTGYKQ